MKTQIRRGVFETNSSSVHTISISKNTVKSARGKSVRFGTGGEFGWGPDLVAGVSSRAQYLWQAILSSFDYRIFDRNGTPYGSDAYFEGEYEIEMKQLEIVKERKSKLESLLNSEGVNFSFVESNCVSISKEEYVKNLKNHTYKPAWKFTQYEPDIAYAIKEDYGYIDHPCDGDILEFLDYVLSDSKHLVEYLFGPSYIEIGNDNEEPHEEMTFNVDDIDYQTFEKGN